MIIHYKNEPHYSVCTCSRSSGNFVLFFFRCLITVKYGAAPNDFFRTRMYGNESVAQSLWLFPKGMTGFLRLLWVLPQAFRALGPFGAVSFSSSGGAGGFTASSTTFWSSWLSHSVLFTTGGVVMRVMDIRNVSNPSLSVASSREFMMPYFTAPSRLFRSSTSCCCFMILFRIYNCLLACETRSRCRHTWSSILSCSIVRSFPCTMLSWTILPCSSSMFSSSSLPIRYSICINSLSSSLDTLRSSLDLNTALSKVVEELNTLTLLTPFHFRSS